MGPYEVCILVNIGPFEKTGALKYDGKGQKIKARLCMRGDREKDKGSIRSDSPTVAKESIKIALRLVQT